MALHIVDEVSLIIFPLKPHLNNKILIICKYNEKSQDSGHQIIEEWLMEIKWLPVSRLLHSLMWRVGRGSNFDAYNSCEKISSNHEKEFHSELT